MHAQLEVARQPVALDCELDHREVLGELLLELRHVTNVIDTLVKAAGEFRRDSLSRNVLVGNRCENDQQFRRSLRAIRLVHRDFGDERSFALYRRDMTIDLACFLHRVQILPGDTFDLSAGCLKGLGNSRNL